MGHPTMQENDTAKLTPTHNLRVVSIHQTPRYIICYYDNNICNGAFLILAFSLHAHQSSNPMI